MTAMTYNIAVYQGSFSNQIDGETVKGEVNAEKAAKRLAKQYPKCQVYASWYRASDGQTGYLNPGRNHEIMGHPW